MPRALSAQHMQAACGARTALVKERLAPVRFESDLAPSISNAIWRRLELQSCGAMTEPVKARRTLLPGGEIIETTKNAQATAKSFADKNENDARLWPDFLRDMEAFRNSRGLVETGRRSLGDYAQFAGRAQDLIADYFQDEKIRAHILGNAFVNIGRGPQEAGSAMTVYSHTRQHAWRVRLRGEKGDWRALLADRCAHFGVDVYDEKIAGIPAPEKTQRSIALASGARVVGKTVFFANSIVASRFGFADCMDDAALYKPDLATATVRLRLSGKLENDLADANVEMMIIDDESDLQNARDDAMAQQIPDKLPIAFEILSNGDILARSAYCPVKFRSDEGDRDWTGQDRQVLAKRFKERLIDRLPELKEKITRTETYVVTPRKGVDIDCRHIVINADSGGDISSAVAKIDAVIAS